MLGLPQHLVSRFGTPFRIGSIHGLGERDHKSLALISPEQLDPVIKKLTDCRGILTLEVFDSDGFFISRKALLDSMARVQHG